MGVEAEDSPRLMPTSVQQQLKAAMEECAPRLLFTRAFQRTAARFLFWLLYALLLMCFNSVGVATATALAYTLTLLVCKVQSFVGNHRVSSILFPPLFPPSALYSWGDLQVGQFVLAYCVAVCLC